MSTFRDPVGPKSPKVYLRRRLVVLAVLLAVIAVIVLAILKPGSGAGAPEANEVKLPTDLAAQTAQSPVPKEGDVPACQSGQLKVTPGTDKTDYAEGELPQLFLSVVNAGTEPCSADLGTAGMEFTVSSGDDQVWRSVDCQADPEALAVILDPDQAVQTEPIAWDRTRSSAETCDITRDPVAAGGASYHLRATVAGVQGSGTAQFLLY